MFLLLDNYDSFTWNIYHYVSELGIKIKVLRNDKVNSEYIRSREIKGIILSPGPGHPFYSGNMLSIIKDNYRNVPILGICLGHQAIAFAFGAKIVKMHKVMHGRTDKIKIVKRNNLFLNIKNSFTATRYHSLEIKKETLPKNIEVTALTADSKIMAIKVKNKNVYGLQFHPESIETEYGKILFKNFVSVCE